MRVETAPSYPISIFIAGDYAAAQLTCRDFCDEVGLCATVTRTSYVFRGGEVSGVIVGLINYPRFPKAPSAILDDAQSLAKLLRTRLHQESYSIQTPEETRWYSWRPDDLAIAAAAFGQDAKRLEAKPGRAAGAQASASPTPDPLSNNHPNKGEDC